MAESLARVGDRHRSGARVLAGNAVLAAVYFAAGRLGLLIPIAQEHVTLLWAPTGLALAAVLRFGHAAVPGVALGAFLVNFTVGGSLGLALLIAAGNTLEAVAGAGLLRWAGFRPSLERVRDVLLFIVFGVLAAPVASATLGTASLAAFGRIPPGQSSLNVAGYWWLGDAMGALLVAPVLLTWLELPRGWVPRPRRVLEACLLGLGLLVTSDLTLNTWVDNPILHPPLAFTLFPFLVWAALRFGSRGAATATLLAVAVAAWATMQGLSPFAASGTLDEGLMYLHTYMAMAAVTSMLLAAVLTERRGVEAGLRESEERLRLALDAGRCGVWDWDIAGQRLTWSDRLFEFHGVDPKDFCGRMEDFTSLVHPEDMERVSAAIQKALESREDYQVEFRIVRPDGQVRWLTTNGRAFYDRAGRPVRMLGATLDVTDRHEAEEERARLLVREQEARAEAEAANEAKDRFLATLSHELRTPLTPVLAVVSSLAGEQLPPELARPFDLVRRNVELEARLIDDLLDLTRIVRGKLELHPEVTDARKVVEHTIEICCEREVAAGRLRLVEDLAAQDHRIWADPSRLTQVMWNLLTNAVKFTPEGGTVTVRSWNERDRLILQVSDTGVGIDPEALPHVFDAFEQGRARSPRNVRGGGGGGLGLGLAISQAIVDMHGGELTAASEGRGRGATFTVSLPASLPQDTGEVPSLDDSVVQSPKAKIQNLNILLVEDHADTAEAMADLLSLMGHRVTTAGTAAGALEAARREQFDLLLSDLGLPDGSGLDVMRELSRRGLRGIALSGYGMEDDIHRSHEAGFSRHLTKPVSLPALEAAIRQTLREKVAKP